MRTWAHRMAWAALALCVSMVTSTPRLAPAAEATRWPVALAAGSELSIEGTSTLHPWSSRTDTLALEFRLAPGTARPGDARALAALVGAQGIAALTVDVPVHTLRSKESKLDKNLWHAMRTDEFPNVHFELASYALLPMRTGSDTLSIHAKGILTICGRERPVELEALAHATEGGLWLVGSEELLMTDYGIRPPTMMMGTIRVGNRIQVHYRLLLVQGNAGAPAATAGSDEKGAR